MSKCYIVTFVLMLNLCIKKFCLCTWQTLLLVQTVILLLDQSCDRENVEYKSQKITTIFIFCKGSSNRKKMHLRMTMKMKILGQCQHHHHLLLTSYHLLLQLNYLLNHLLTLSSQNQVSSRGRGTQRKTSLISSRGHGEAKQSVQVIFQVLRTAK